MFRTNGEYPLYILYHIKNSLKEGIQEDTPQEEDSRLSTQLKKKWLAAHQLEQAENELARLNDEKEYFNKVYTEKVNKLTLNIAELKTQVK